MSVDPIAFLLPLLGGILLYVIIKIYVRLPGKRLHQRFIKLGNFATLKKDDFIKAVGQPQAISNHDGGIQLLQWRATGYSMAVIFDKDGRFVKIQSEIQS